MRSVTGSLLAGYKLLRKTSEKIERFGPERIYLCVVIRCFSILCFSSSFQFAW